MRARPSVLSATLSLALTSPALAANIAVLPGGSIQDAVDAALNNADTIDVIAVFPDIYDESVVIDFSGSNQQLLTVGRAEQFRPIITGGVSIADARLVTLFGFEVGSTQGDGDAAIRISDSTGAAIIDCTIQDGDDGGIDALDTFEVIVDSCKVSGMMKHGVNTNGFGVRIRGRSCHRVVDSKFKDNEFRGIWVEADRAEITNCKISNGEDGSDHAGVHLEGLQNVFKKNTVNGNDGHGVVAIGTFDIRSNKIFENGRVGLRLGKDTGTQFFGGLVKNNTIRDNGSFGIQARAGQDGAELAKNTIDGNRGAGIKLEGDAHHVDKNDIRKTKSSSDPGHGVFIDSTSDDNCVENNTFKDNDGSAVRVDGDFNYVLKNVAKGGDSFVNSGGTTGNDGRANDTSGQNDFP